MMKSTGFLATFSVILFVQITRGQQNGLLSNKNIESNNLLSQQYPSQTMANMIQRYLDQKEKISALSNNANERQGPTETNSQPSLLNTQKQQVSNFKELTPLQRHLKQQEPLQVQQVLQLQPSLQTQQDLKPQQPQRIQQPLGLQQNSIPPISNFQGRIDSIQSPITQHQVCNQQFSNPQINVKLQARYPQMVNIEESVNPNVIQPQQIPTKTTEAITTPPNACNQNQDISNIRYQISSQQPSPLPSSNSQIVPNPSIALAPSYDIKPTDQTYIPPYNYAKPVSEVQPAVIERSAVTNTVQALPTILTLPSPVIQNTQTPIQTYYYNTASDPKQSVYINQNQGSWYSQQPISVTALQSQPTVVQSQPSVLSPVPVSIVQAPQITPQYKISAYPVNTIMSPPYPSQKQKTSNLKSFLPLILNLLKEKIATCGCQNGCPSECKNDSVNNGLEVSSGYSNQKHYGVLKENGLSMLNKSGESEGTECLRTRKNSVKHIKDVEEISDETQEEEDSDEEEVSDEDD